jgi:hypothetical protein
MTLHATAQRQSQLRAALGDVFLGDWHPRLRDPLDLFRLSFVVGALVFTLRGETHGAGSARAHRRCRVRRAHG